MMVSKTSTHTLEDFFQWAEPNNYAALCYKNGEGLGVEKPRGIPNPFGGDWADVTLDGQILADELYYLLKDKFGLCKSWSEEEKEIKVLLNRVDEYYSFLTCNIIYQVLEKARKLALQLVLSPEKAPEKKLEDEPEIFSLPTSTSATFDIKQYFIWAKHGSSKAFIETLQPKPDAFHFVKPMRPAAPLACDSITLSSQIIAEDFWTLLEKKLDQDQLSKGIIKALLQEALDGDQYFTRWTVYRVMDQMVKIKAWVSHNSPLLALASSCPEAKNVDAEGQKLTAFFKWAKLGSRAVFTHPQEDHIFFHFVRPSKPILLGCNLVGLSNQMFAQRFWQQLKSSQEAEAKEWPKAEVKQLLKSSMCGHTYFTRDTMHHVKMAMHLG